MSEPPVLAARDGAVLRLTLNRPDRLNAVNEALYRGLLDHLGEADADPAVRCVLLTGAGRAFCVGADLKEHAEGTRGAADRDAYVSLGQRAAAAVQRLGVPVVAAVHGYAVGAGAELAVSADLLLMADDARMRFPEVRLGTFVGGGVTHRLPALVGLRKATELLLLGDWFSGEEAVAFGLAHDAPPSAALDDTARRIADTLAGAAPLSVAAMKRHLAGAGQLDEALAAEAETLRGLMDTADWREGIAAFTDRRTPDFQGR